MTTPTTTCRAVLNIKGAHVPCDNLDPHDTHRNEEAGAIWVGAAEAQQLPDHQPETRSCAACGVSWTASVPACPVCGATNAGQKLDEISRDPAGHARAEYERGIQYGGWIARQAVANRLNLGSIERPTPADDRGGAR